MFRPGQRLLRRRNARYALRKMREHIAKFDEWQREVEKLEREEGEAGYALKAALTNSFPYTKAVSQRNGHQQAALMWGIASIAEELGAAREDHHDGTQG